MVVSCDGNRLAFREKICALENTDNKNEPLNSSFVVPGKTLSQLMRLISDDDEASAVINGMALYGNSGFDITSVLIIVAVVVVAAGLVAAIVALAVKRKKKLQQD